MLTLSGGKNKRADPWLKGSTLRADSADAATNFGFPGKPSSIAVYGAIVAWVLVRSLSAKKSPVAVGVRDRGKGA